jgi:N-dimethylarginine dimethylaminohydrolase
MTGISYKNEGSTMKMLMCKPNYYGIEYEINPWMNRKIKVNSLTAMAQWGNLYSTISRCGVQVELVEPEKEVPDMVFTANAGLVVGKQVYLAHFRHPERHPERRYFRNWFVKSGYQLADEIDLTLNARFEGEGDALFAGQTLFAGFGIRSEKSCYTNFVGLDPSTLVYCELVDPYFYHLDTCFCPLNAGIALWWPDAFSKESQKAMRNAIELIALPENEVRRFACNSIVLGKEIIIPSECPRTSDLLQNMGFTVHVCDVSEFIKAGGACKCLTLFI